MKKINSNDIDKYTMVCPFCMEDRSPDTHRGCCGESSGYFEEAYVLKNGECYLDSEVEIIKIPNDGELTKPDIYAGLVYILGGGWFWLPMIGFGDFNIYQSIFGACLGTLMIFLGLETLKIKGHYNEEK